MTGITQQESMRIHSDYRAHLQCDLGRIQGTFSLPGDDFEDHDHGRYGTLADLHAICFAKKEHYNGYIDLSRNLVQPPE